MKELRKEFPMKIGIVGVILMRKEENAEKEDDLVYRVYEVKKKPYKLLGTCQLLQESSGKITPRKIEGLEDEETWKEVERLVSLCF